MTKIRMILAHPRSRSHLLGSAYPDYVNELFTPGFIMHTPYFHRNEHLVKFNETMDYAGEFGTGYIKWIDETFTDKQFTFKVHYCDVYDWPEALSLITKWLDEPNSEVVTIERICKELSVLSVLVADMTGYVSYDMRQCEPQIVTRQHIKSAVDRVYRAWYAGMRRWGKRSVYNFKYENLVSDATEIFFGGDPNKFQEFAKDCRFKDQGTASRLDLIKNRSQVQLWINEEINKVYDEFPESRTHT
jgi:hypothetical protein